MARQWSLLFHGQGFVAVLCDERVLPSAALFGLIYDFSEHRIRLPTRRKAVVMRRISAALALLLLVAGGSAFAQVQNGNISGSVKDQQGGVLPGVVATLAGVDVTHSF